MASTFTCAHCQGVFEKARSDDEAAAELSSNFPTYTQAECTIICDNCYEAVSAWMETPGGKAARAEVDKEERDQVRN